ncbi:hypothetical protein ACVWXN_009196 [Bradyrhizobium sp. i1.4.4]
MLEAIRRAMTFLRQKQVLHKLGVVISVAVIGIACYVLYHMLRGIDVNEVLEAIKSTEPSQIAMAALFVAAGYFTLTFYDLFAVRAIGHAHVPYRINALAAFTSYSIGHNVGASVFTGGAVRYRIYSAYGLNAIDVAKICFLAGLTFWLGNAAVLGLGISYHPEAAAAIDQLPPWLNRMLAMMIIAGLVAYVVWVWTQPRVVGRGPWTVVLPGGPLTLLQIAIGIIDLGFCALGDVRAGPGRAQSRLRRGGGDLRLGDAARFRQPLAGRARRVRCRHAGRPLADGPRGTAGWHAPVPRPLLSLPLRHICNLADVSRGYNRRSIEALAAGGAQARPRPGA